MQPGPSAGAAMQMPGFRVQMFEMRATDNEFFILLKLKPPGNVEKLDIMPAISSGIMVSKHFSQVPQFLDRSPSETYCALGTNPHTCMGVRPARYAVCLSILVAMAPSWINCIVSVLSKRASIGCEPSGAELPK
jgi:hypothetical protein